MTRALNDWIPKALCPIVPGMTPAIGELCPYYHTWPPSQFQKTSILFDIWTFDTWHLSDDSSFQWAHTNSNVLLWTFPRAMYCNAIHWTGHDPKINIFNWIYSKASDTISIILNKRIKHSHYMVVDFNGHTPKYIFSLIWYKAIGYIGCSPKPCNLIVDSSVQYIKLSAFKPVPWMRFLEA